MAIPTNDDFRELRSLTNNFTAMNLYEESSRVEMDFSEVKRFLINVGNEYNEQYKNIVQAKAYQWLHSDPNYLKGFEREFGVEMDFAWGESWAERTAEWLLGEPLSDINMNSRKEHKLNLANLCRARANFWLCDFAETLQDYFYQKQATHNKNSISSNLPKLEKTLKIATDLYTDLGQYSALNSLTKEAVESQKSINRLRNHIKFQLYEIKKYSAHYGSGGETLQTREFIWRIWQWFVMCGMGSKQASIVDFVNIEGVTPISQRSVENRIKELKQMYGRAFLSYPNFDDKTIRVGSLMYKKLELKLMGVNTEGKFKKLKN
jgi:hypothetical protein